MKMRKRRIRGWVGREAGGFFLLWSIAFTAARQATKGRTFAWSSRSAPPKQKGWRA